MKYSTDILIALLALIIALIMFTYALLTFKFKNL